MWTRATRGRMAGIEKKNKRYPSDLTDEEWSSVEPLLPRPARRGRKRTTALRQDGANVDMWFTKNWRAPGCMINDVGVCLVGGAKKQGAGIFGRQPITTTSVLIEARGR